MKKELGNIYLIPNVLAENTLGKVFPMFNKEIISHLNYFIVEDLRNARRFLKKIDRNINIDNIHFELIDKHAKIISTEELLKPVLEGKNCGVLSEAGSPCIADPGSIIVSAAHKKNINIIPLIGPNSILLALDASGFNGQSFAFHGYLPINSKERNERIRELEKLATHTGQTQIFMETPYRNNHLIDGILSVCHKDTLLCIAANITSEKEFIKTKTVSKWQSGKPDLHKIPSIFLLGK